MGTHTCLSSRAAAGTRSAKQARGFLALPAELRIQVYECCFQPDIYCELAAKGRSFVQSKPRTVKLSSGVQPVDACLSECSAATKQAPLTIRVARRLGKYDIVQGLRTKWSTSIHVLHLICRQLYAETLAFIYRNTVFVFDAPRRVNNFLHVVSKPSLKNITKLHLHFSTYGAPKTPESCHWQERHLESWTRACKAAASSLKRLHGLAIWVQVNQSPLRFSLREPWVAPLLQFRRLGRTMGRGVNLESRSQLPQALKTVTVHVCTHWSKNSLVSFNGNADLANASEHLHQLFGRAISSAMLGASEMQAMADFNTAWKVTHRDWQYHLGFAQINW